MARFHYVSGPTLALVVVNGISFYYVSGVLKYARPLPRDHKLNRS